MIIVNPRYYFIFISDRNSDEIRVKRERVSNGYLTTLKIPLIGWIPGLGIAITFFWERFFISQSWKWINLSRWFWKYQNFGPISWEFGFLIFSKILKLRGRRPYAWVFPSQNRQMCISFYAGHFDMRSCYNRVIMLPKCHG